MENDNIEKINFFEKVRKLILIKKNYLISFISIILIVIFSLIFLDYYKNKTD